MLYVQGTGFLVPFSEEYRRVRYRDVQAVTVAETRGWLVMNLVCGILLLIFGVPAILGLVTVLGGPSGIVGEEAFALVTAVVCGSIATVLLGMVIWNVVRGKTCKFGIQTANGLVVVRSANRVKVAERVLTELAPLVEEKQVKRGSTDG